MSDKPFFNLVFGAFQLVSTYPEWQRFGFKALDIEQKYYLVWAFTFAFWELRKWNMTTAEIEPEPDVFSQDDAP